jgi:hypothetical protein
MSALENIIDGPTEETQTSGLSLMEQQLVEDTLKIAALEAQIAQANALLEEQNQMLLLAANVVCAARSFVELVSSSHDKTGEPMFKIAGEPDSVLSETLGFRYADLASALNGIGRPVPPKLAEGTVH